MATDEQIVERLRALLGEVDMQTTSEKMLRKMLEKEFSMELSGKKELIRAEVNRFLEEQPGSDDDGGDAQGTDEELESEQAEREAAGASMRGAAMGSILSPELQAFLGVESMPRPKVVKAIWVYIKEHNLQNPKNKRKLILDEKLRTIFTDPVDMFSMNKQLSRHCKTADGGGEGRPRARSAPKAKRQKQSSEEDEEDEDDEAPRKKSKANGFTKPVKVSAAMAEFLGQSEISRPQFTKFIFAYADEHNLKDPTDKRFIIPDDRLAAVAGPERFQAFGAASKILKAHIVQD